MLDFRIETFLCVCRYLNYTKAAEELNITQPGVSQHIHYLEEYYGDKLFLYQNKKLTLTKTGSELKEAMLSFKNDTIHIKNKIRERIQGEEKLSFGATKTIGEFFLPEKITNYLTGNHQVNLDFLIDNTQNLLELLDKGELDFALVEGYFNKNGYESRVISRERYGLVCGQDYKILEPVTIKELLEHRLILREQGSGSREIMERFLKKQGYEVSDFSNTSTSNSIPMIKKLVESNLGISFMYETAVKTELEQKQLRILEMEEEVEPHEFHFIWRKNSAFSLYYETLFQNIFQNK